MKKLKELLESWGYEFKSCWEDGILACTDNNMIDISKSYKGYEVEVIYWVNDSIGKSTKFKSTRVKDIIKFLKSERIN